MKIIDNVNRDRAINDHRYAICAALLPLVGTKILKGDGGLCKSVRAALPPHDGCTLTTSGAYSLVLRTTEALCYVDELSNGVLTKVLSIDEQGTFPTIDPGEFEIAFALAKKKADEMMDLMRPFSAVCHVNYNLTKRLS